MRCLSWANAIRPYTLAVGFVLAMVFTFSCSGDGSRGGGGGDDDSSSSVAVGGGSSSSARGGKSSSSVGDAASSSSGDATVSSSSVGGGDNDVSSSSVDSVVSSSSVNNNNAASSSSLASTECTSWGNWVVTKPATCDAEGLKTRSCASGITKTETEAIPELEWGNWEIKTPASGTTPAKGERKCPNGEVDKKDLSICGTNKPFAPAEEFCLDGVVKELCGTATYAANQFCLNGAVKAKCGTAEFTSTQFCLNGTVTGKCGGTVEYASNQFCQAGTDAVKPLCGTATFTATQFCQSPNVVKDLCGTATFTATQFCQSPNVVKDLCGTATFTANQFCQSPNVVKDLCGTATFTANQFCQSPNVVKDLCGTATFTATEECCGSTKYTLATQQCQSNVIVTKCGSGWYNSATQFCYDNSKVGDFCGARPETFDPDLYKCETGDKIYLKTPVSYGGQNYEAVLIGTQTWMAENLNYNASGSRCYGDNTGGDSQNRCGTYGRLYNWATAMGGSASSSANPSGVRGVCPPNWHLPSDAEWTALTTAVGGESTAGTKLKANSSLWSTNTGTDEFGFSALPGGGGFSDGSFSDVGYYGYWWSATESSASYAYIRSMNYYNAYVNSYDDDKAYLFSVRCVQDY